MTHYTSIILRNPFSAEIHVGKIVLARGISAFGRLLIPIGRYL